MMKNHVLVSLLLLLLCAVELGSSYLCYTCTMAMSDQSCLATANCTGATPYCGTTVVNTFGINWISKYCSAVCISSNQNMTVASASETCCASDLCNNMKIGDGGFSFNGAGSGATCGGLLLGVTIGLLSLAHCL